MVKNILITGTSSGIGHALAAAYLKQEARVFGLSRRKPEDLCAQENFQFESADFSDLNAIQPALNKLLSGIDHLDLVVLNAGVLGRIGDMAEISVEEMKRVMDVNLWANKALLDGIFQRNIPVRQVVAISSGAAIAAKRGWNAYSLSKAALNMLAGLYAAERPGTHFCALAPGIVDTPMQDELYGVPSDARFPSLDLLRAAKGSPMMPKPEAAAERLIDGIDQATGHSSGSFLDIRSLDN